MIDAEKLIQQIAAKNAALADPADYEKDGFLYCGHCGTAKQCRIRFPFGERVVSCQCTCAQRKWEAEQKAEADQQRAIFVKQLRASGIQDKSLQNCRFDTAEETEEIRKCRRYVDHWDEMRKNNTGLLFWGNCGGGKSFAAACITNELIDKGVPAMVTSFPRILSAGWDRQEITYQLRHYDLVVIDDLGTERGSDMALETIFLVIDERYKAKKPLIVTTNLSVDALKNPEDLKYQRIYDRVLEMCVPVSFRGKNRRDDVKKDKRSHVRAILEG